MPTTVDLFRSGNASSARMDNVRPVDVVTQTINGVVYVLPASGGISTFSSAAQINPVKWKLAAGYAYNANLVVTNNGGGHYSWRPAVRMTMDDYKALLALVNNSFSRLASETDFLPAMNLSTKDLRFIIAAISAQQQQFTQQLQRNELGEDDAADLSNDTQYLEAIKYNLQAHHDTLVAEALAAAGS